MGHAEIKLKQAQADFDAKKAAYNEACAKRAEAWDAFRASDGSEDCPEYAAWDAACAADSEAYYAMEKAEAELGYAKSRVLPKETQATLDVGRFYMGGGGVRWHDTPDVATFGERKELIVHLKGNLAGSWKFGGALPFTNSDRPYAADGADAASLKRWFEDRKEALYA